MGPLPLLTYSTLGSNGGAGPPYEFFVRVRGGTTSTSISECVHKLDQRSGSIFFSSRGTLRSTLGGQLVAYGRFSGNRKYYLLSHQPESGRCGLQVILFKLQARPEAPESANLASCPLQQMPRASMSNPLQAQVSKLKRQP